MLLTTSSVNTSGFSWRSFSTKKSGLKMIGWLRREESLQMTKLQMALLKKGKEEKKCSNFSSLWFLQPAGLPWRRHLLTWELPVYTNSTVWLQWVFSTAQLHFPMGQNNFWTVCTTQPKTITPQRDGGIGNTWQQPIKTFTTSTSLLLVSLCLHRTSSGRDDTQYFTLTYCFKSQIGLVLSPFLPRNSLPVACKSEKQSKFFFNGQLTFISSHCHSITFYISINK